MSLITANSLSKSFGAEDLFSGVSFSVAKGARLALVGPNGIGKTTLLRILIGQEEPSAGRVTRAKSLRIGYLPQEADFELEGTVWDVCLEPSRTLSACRGNWKNSKPKCPTPRNGSRHWSAMERCSMISSGAADTSIRSASNRC